MEDFDLQKALMLVIRSTMDQQNLELRKTVLPLLYDCANLSMPIRAGASSLVVFELSQFNLNKARLTMHDRTWRVKIFGEEVVGVDGVQRLNSCVLCVTAVILGVSKNALYAKVKEEHVLWKENLSKVEGLLSVNQVRMIRWIHDLELGEGLDCNMLRYLELDGLFSNVRINVLIHHQGVWRVVKMVHPNFVATDPNAVCACILIANNHATVVTRLPDGLGGELQDDQGNIRSIVQQEASAMESGFGVAQIEMTVALC